MRKNWKKRLGAALLALCLVSVTPLSVCARTLAEIEAEQAQLEQEKVALEAKLDQLRDDEAQKQAYQETLEEQITLVESQIDTARKNIDELNASINELTLKLEKSEEEMEETIQEFRQRVVALYKGGSVSTLQILLDSTSFSDFSFRTEMLEAMSKWDQKLIEKIEAYMESTQAEREESEAKKEEVANLKKGLESKQDELDGLYEENAAAIAELQNAQANTQAAIEENEQQGADAIAEAEALIAEQKRLEELAKQEAASGGGGGGGSIAYPSGGGGVEGFNPIWPLPGVTYITCYYGDGGHKGLDIAGPYGTPIVAAESGQVLSAEFHYSWGNNVLIYHNGTYSTRYAHMSAMAVSPGEYVVQGQVVGYEGSTGNSTGPHLHFEVYENGVRVNPMGYL